MSTTTEKVAALRAENPRMLAKHMAEEIGVSRERVRQILKKLELPTRIPSDRLCWTCQTPITLPNKRYCSNACLGVAVRTWIQCGVCGGFKRMRNSSLRGQKRRGYTDWYCSRKCLFRMMGRTYGFLAHPENTIYGSRGGTRGKKYDARIS